MADFWDMAHCILKEVNRHVRGTYCLHYEGDGDSASTHL
jgi:hypothetical protein